MSMTAYSRVKESPHNGDMITFHRIADFRSLVY